MAFTWASAIRIAVLLLLIAAVTIACFTLPIDKPITLALVYIVTTLKDLSDVTRGWHNISRTRVVFIVLGVLVSALLLICVARVAKAALDKALAENEEIDGMWLSPELPVVAEEPPVDVNQPLLIKDRPS